MLVRIRLDFIESCMAALVVLFEDLFFALLLANNVSFYNTFYSAGTNFSVPNSFWPDNENGPSLAHSEVIDIVS